MGPNVAAASVLHPISWSEDAVTGADRFVLPVGIVTLLLADLERSSRLWEEREAEMPVELARLDDLVNEAVRRHGGVRPLEQGEGDSFVAAFARPSDAVECALALQLGLRQGPLKLRIGVHTGEVQMRGAENYIGRTVNRAARIRDLGHGGQVLVSQATRDLVTDRLPENTTLEHLGEHRLRDLSLPEQIFQLHHPELHDSFPPLRSLDVVPHNLPVQLTSFIGRQREVDELLGLLDDTRLLTLTGSGGCGKTRLALHVAGLASPRFADGVWFVDLSAVADDTSVASAVAGALSFAASVDPLQTLCRLLSGWTTLIVLDNCEHVVNDCAELTDRVLRAAPHVTVLATSRERLDVPGEVTFRVPSLAVPPVDEPLRLEGLTQYAAVELFFERARRADPHFAPLDDDAAVIAEICQRLDGIPLAVELAAARTRVLPLREILDGLHDRFRLLTRGARTVLPRQQTLEASVDWSHALLSPPERALLRRLSVFAGGFTVAAARAVGAEADLEAHHVLDLLSLLVDKSLVQRDGRYHLLETIRQYSLERLREAGEEERTRDRHLDHFMQAAEDSGPRVRGGDEDCANELAADEHNLAAALSWAQARRRDDELGRLAAALAPYWALHGAGVAGREWTEAALSGELSIPVRAAVLAAGALLAMNSEDAGVGEAYAREAQDLFTAAGDEAGVAAVMAPLAYFSYVRGEMETAMSLAAEGLETARRLDRSDLAAHVDTGCLFVAGYVALYGRGDLARARELFEERRDAARAAGHARGERGGRADLARVLVAEGRYAEASQLAHDVLREARPVNDLRNVSVAVLTLKDADVALGRAETEREIESIATHFVQRGFRPTWWPDAILLDVAYTTGRVEEAIERGLRLLPCLPPSPMARAAYAVRLGRAFTATGAADAARRQLAATLATPQTRRHRHLLEAEVLRLEMRPDEAETAALAAAAGPGFLDFKFRVASLEVVAGARADQHEWSDSARLLAAADAAYTATGAIRFPFWAEMFQAGVARLKEALAEDDFEAAWREGARMSLEDAVAWAARGRGERRRPPVGWGSLTPTEQQVVALVAEGLTNRDVAERLLMAPATVKSHLLHVYAKLGVSSRTELAAAVAKRASGGC